MRRTSSQQAVGFPAESEGSRDVVPPGPPDPHPQPTDRPDDLLPPPPEDWGQRKASTARRDDDVSDVRREPGPEGGDPPVLERIERDLASVRRAWTIGVVTAAILAGVVIYALLSPPPRVVSIQTPASNALHKANGRIDALEGRVSDLKREIESRTKNAGGRLKTLKRCFNQALQVEQHRMDLLLKRRLSAKHFLGLSPPLCST